MTNGALASWGRRAAARIVDTFFILAFLAAVGTAIGVASGDGWVGFVVALLGYYLVEPFYYSIFHGTRRAATPGKRLLGITVRRVDGTPHGFGLAFGRAWLAWLFSWIPFLPLIDYLWPLWDAQNQTLHDKCVGTVVVRTAVAQAPTHVAAATAPEPLTAEQRLAAGR